MLPVPIAEIVAQYTDEESKPLYVAALFFFQAKPPKFQSNLTPFDHWLVYFSVLPKEYVPFKLTLKDIDLTSQFGILWILFRTGLSWEWKVAIQSFGWSQREFSFFLAQKFDESDEKTRKEFCEILGQSNAHWPLKFVLKHEALYFHPSRHDVLESLFIACCHSGQVKKLKLFGKIVPNLIPKHLVFNGFLIACRNGLLGATKYLQQTYHITHKQESTLPLFLQILRYGHAHIVYYLYSVWSKVTNQEHLETKSKSNASVFDIKWKTEKVNWAEEILFVYCYTKTHTGPILQFLRQKLDFPPYLISKEVRDKAFVLLCKWTNKIEMLDFICKDLGFGRKQLLANDQFALGVILSSENEPVFRYCISTFNLTAQDIYGKNHDLYFSLVNVNCSQKWILRIYTKYYQKRWKSLGFKRMSPREQEICRIMQRRSERFRKLSSKWLAKEPLTVLSCLKRSAFTEFF